MIIISDSFEKSTEEFLEYVRKGNKIIDRDANTTFRLYEFRYDSHCYEESLAFTNIKKGNLPAFPFP